MPAMPWLPKATVQASYDEKPPSTNKVEILKAIVIREYKEDDVTKFQLDISDIVSVEEQKHTHWLGTNLRTGRLGIFPPSHVEPLDIWSARETAEKNCGGVTKESSHETAADRFHKQFGEEADPETILNVLPGLKSLDMDDFWLCLPLVYPQLEAGVMTLLGSLQQLSDAIRSHSRPFEGCFTIGYSWKFSSQLHRDYDGLWSKWWSAEKSVRERLSEAEQAWSIILSETTTSKIPARITSLITISRLDMLLAFLRQELRLQEDRIEDAMRKDVTHVRALETLIGDSPRAHDQYYYTYPTGWTQIKPLKRRKLGTLWHSWLDERKVAKSHSKYPSSWWNRLQELSAARWRFFKDFLADTETVFRVVILLSITSVITTGLATWKCSSPDIFPTIDSNFWSTLSSAFISIGSLYCTILPALQEGSINVRDPRIFRFFLVIGLVAALTAVLSYPFQMRLSLVLASGSSVAQLAATLQIILGAVNKIEEQNFELEGLRQRVPA